MKAARNETDHLLNDLIGKVDLLIRVTSIQVGADKSMTERARLLKIAGLDNQAIAEVLNTSAATIRTVTSNLRRVRRR